MKDFTPWSKKVPPINRRVLVTWPGRHTFITRTASRRVSTSLCSSPTHTKKFKEKRKTRTVSFRCIRKPVIYVQYMQWVLSVRHLAGAGYTPVGAVRDIATYSLTQKPRHDGLTACQRLRAKIKSVPLLRGKAIPSQANKGLESFRRLRLPEFKTTGSLRW